MSQALCICLRIMLTYHIDPQTLCHSLWPLYSHSLGILSNPPQNEQCLVVKSMEFGVRLSRLESQILSFSWYMDSVCASVFLPVKWSDNSI